MIFCSMATLILYSFGLLGCVFVVSEEYDKVHLHNILLVFRPSFHFFIVSLTRICERRAALLCIRCRGIKF